MPPDPPLEMDILGLDLGFDLPPPPLEMEILGLDLGFDPTPPPTPLPPHPISLDFGFESWKLTLKNFEIGNAQNHFQPPSGAPRYHVVFLASKSDALGEKGTSQCLAIQCEEA